MRRPHLFLMAAVVVSVVFAARALAGPEGAGSGAPADTSRLRDRVEGIDAQVQILQGDVDKLKRIKLSGYVQARYEVNELSSDKVTVSGGNITKTPNTNRFFIRRGRMKLTYDSSPLSQAVIYFDASTSGTDPSTSSAKNLYSLGFARLLEAYVTLKDPWTPDHRHYVSVGQMNIPFGYEIERSSSVRELPERSKAENVLFPGERDRGITVTNQWTYEFQTVVGLLNGMGITNTDYPTSTPRRGKDFVGRARWSHGIFDVAGSVYVGRNLVPLAVQNFTHDKTRYGADAQYYYGLPRLGGGSLKAEFYTGHEVNPDSVKALAPSRTLAAGKDPEHLATNFVGWYAMFVQNLGETLQVAGRYDTFDPNTDMDHDQFSRLNVAVNLFYDANTRLTAAYEIPMIDTKDATGKYSDIKDNIWTFQLQHKF